MLGKKSGKQYDKENYLARKKQIEIWNDKKVLSGCAGIMELEKLWSKEAGDHTMFLFDVKQFQTNDENVLMLDDLRAKRLIRI
jgi:flavin reductase (DIM6/NTAB) family NADH-FMN oxidoreductase RutF